MFGFIEKLMDRLLRRLICFAVAACLGLAAICVAMAALYWWLVLWMTASAALVIVALILLIAALALARIGIGSKTAKSAPAPALSGDMMPNLMGIASDVAGSAVRADPLGAMLGAGAAGFILETRPDLDHALVQQVLRQFLSRS